MKTENSHISRLLIAFITSIVGGTVVAAPADRASQPKLVVGIMVEDLREEYIDLLKEYFSTSGFNLLLNRGVTIKNIDYGTPLDPTAATAVIYTGASPAVNGVPADEVFDLSTFRGIPLFTDQTTIGNYTDQTLSPRAMGVSTISDEVRIAGDGDTYVYAVAPEASQALVMASHAGSCGMWINDANDCWATTTYYREVPPMLNEINRANPLSARIDTMTWSPMHIPAKYMLVPKQVANRPFRYDFHKKGMERIHAFKNSPKVNNEVTALAIDHIDRLHLGGHDGPDMLSLAYTVSPYAYSRDANNRFETIDAYYRLDDDLTALFSAIDRKVGLPNTLIFLAATPPSQRSKRDDERWQIPYGQFSTRKAISLLNLYFIALYGNGNWVVGYHNGEFFLNRQLIHDEEKPLDTMRTQAAAFLAQMSGVSSSYSIDDIINNKAGLHAAPLKQNTNVKYAGDVKIRLLPGWEVIDDFNNPSARPDQVSRLEAVTAPAYIFAPGVAPKVVTAPVDARQIAPTVTGLLRIRAPNASTLPALDLEF